MEHYKTRDEEVLIFWHYSGTTRYWEMEQFLDIESLIFAFDPIFIASFRSMIFNLKSQSHESIAFLKLN